MNFFIVYMSLPALFYRILAKTPLEQLGRVDFVFSTTLATFWVFSLSFGGRDMLIRKGDIAESPIAGLADGYGNIGYMGPGRGLATLGPRAAVPVALRPLQQMPWKVPPLRPALNVFVFARQCDCWVEHASTAVLVGSLLSLIRLTAVMWMVKSGALPPLSFK